MNIRRALISVAFVLSVNAAEAAPLFFTFQGTLTSSSAHAMADLGLLVGGSFTGIISYDVTSPLTPIGPGPRYGPSGGFVSSYRLFFPGGYEIFGSPVSVLQNIPGQRITFEDLTPLNNSSVPWYWDDGFLSFHFSVPTATPMIVPGAFLDGSIAFSSFFPPGYPTPRDYFISGNITAVQQIPTPSTWLMLLTGVGVARLYLRGRSVAHRRT